MELPKLCKDCKWCHFNKKDPSMSKCGYPPDCLIDGVTPRHYCESMRIFKDKDCGYYGNWFEPKEKED